MGGLLARQAKDGMVPSNAQIESTAKMAGMHTEAVAERRILEWSDQGLPVAERELALLLRDRPGSRERAMLLLAKAGRAGDGEAAFQLGEMYRAGDRASQGADIAKASTWYQMAAQLKHAKAALRLAMMARNGDNAVRDDSDAAKWLTLSGTLGNAQAKLLLSEAYQRGEGVPRDPAKARQLLEQSAQQAYAPAMRALAQLTTAERAQAPGTVSHASYARPAERPAPGGWSLF